MFIFQTLTSITTKSQTLLIPYALIIPNDHDDTELVGSPDTRARYGRGLIVA